MDSIKMKLPKNKFGILNKIQLIQPAYIRFKILDKLFQAIIPFNSGLGFEIKKLDTEACTIYSPEKRRRQNHVGGAHACAIALLGEYTAGLLLGQHCNPEQFRIIISHLEVEYHKQGRGPLTATCLKPNFAIFNPIANHSDADKTENPNQKNLAEKEMFVDLVTIIKNSNNDDVATVKTKWQAKSWSLVRK